MVVYAILAILLIALLVFGISSGMESYASAQQAQAISDVAQVAQINAWTNSVLVLALLTLLAVIVGAIVFGMYIWMRVNKSSKPRTHTQSGVMPLPPGYSLDTLLQLRMLDMLDRTNGEQLPPRTIEAPTEAEPEPFHWLR